VKRLHGCFPVHRRSEDIVETMLVWEEVLQDISRSKGVVREAIEDVYTCSNGSVDDRNEMHNVEENESG